MGAGRGFFGTRKADFGRGRGYRNFWNRSDAPVPAEPVTKADELDSLRSEVEGLKNSLSSILDRLSVLTSRKNES
jgi:hypothetical protein